jgi:hypothetical protein
MHRFCFMFFLCCGSTIVLAQDSSSEIEKLRQKIAAQQQQLDEQNKTLQEQQRILERLSTGGIASSQTVQSPAPEPTKTAALKEILPAKSGNATENFSPLSFRIGGADFTPGGFLDLSTVWRSTNVGSGVATAFGSIPANNSPAGRLSEWRFSAYNSRLTLKITERPFKNVLATAYFENDFAGSLPSNAYVTGNSMTFRMRQAWIGIETGKFEILGGQAWSLITPNRVGTSSIPSEMFLGLEQDSAYLAGLVWARQSQIRAIYHATPRWTLAFSAENPQQYVTSAVTLPSRFVSQFDTNSGNSSIANARPDFAAKLAYDAKPGNHAIHIEIAGISRQFRTLNSDNVQHSAQGLGGSVNMSIEPVKNLRWILTSFFSSGGGRYIMGLGPDVVVAPDGSISPVHSTAGITGLEYQFRPTSQLFAYYSGAYFSRNYLTVSPGNYLGFGYPGSSSSSNRQIQEATAGYVHTFWKDRNYGALQLFTQYSYLTRSPWYALLKEDGEMHTHIMFFGLRFSIP